MAHVRRFTLAVATAVSTLLVGSQAVPAATSSVSFGVSEDASKYADDGGKSVYSSLNALGMSGNRWTLTFDGDPSSIAERPFLDRAVPAASRAGIDITLSLFPARAQAPDANAFCEWVGNVASTYRGVKRFIIGNEVNATRFWSPQHTPSDANAGPNGYEATLARCYDTLKGISGDIQVIGMGLAPRSVDGNSTKPLDFIRAVGKAYKASGRTAPLMDEIAVHPYPNPNASPPPAPDNAGYQDPGFYGIPQLDRVKQAVYDAFNGTTQPTTQNGLKILVDEIGYQSNENGESGYTGTESSPSVSEGAQADYYAHIVELYACDPSISAVFIFHLVDEANLNVSAGSGGWQSGLQHPDGSTKPSYDAVKAAIGGGCTGTPVNWAPGGTGATSTPTPASAPLALFSESVPAAATDGPIGELVDIPSAALDQLVRELTSQIELQLLFRNSLTFDPGLVFWRSSFSTQQAVLASAYMLSVSDTGSARGGAQGFLATLWTSAGHSTQGKKDFWDTMCSLAPAKFGCGASRNLTAAERQRATVLAAGSVKLASGSKLRVPLRRVGPVKPGTYITVLRVQSASDPAKVAFIALAPHRVTAADIAAAKRKHGGHGKG